MTDDIHYYQLSISFDVYIIKLSTFTVHFDEALRKGSFWEIKYQILVKQRDPLFYSRKWVKNHQISEQTINGNYNSELSGSQQIKRERNPFKSVHYVTMPETDRSNSNRHIQFASEKKKIKLVSFLTTP